MREGGAGRAVILDRYLAREIGTNWVGAALVLTLIFAGQQVVRILDRVVSGELKGPVVLDLVGYTLLGNLTILLPFALYLAILLGIGRLYRDSEMAAMAACGYGELQAARTVGAFALVVTVVSLVWGLWGAPWAERSFQQTWEAASRTTGVAGLTPGAFNEFSTRDGKGVLYAEGVERDTGELTGVFIRTPTAEERGESVVVAAAGRQFRDPVSGRRFLELEDGTRYEGEPGRGDYRVTAFQRQRVHLPAPDPVAVDDLDTLPTAALMASDDPEYRAEFHWRLAIPLSTLPLALLAVPLARTSPRQGRYSRLFTALLLFMLYGNLMGLARGWVESGRVPEPVGLWWVHALVLVLAGAMLAAGQRLRQPRQGRRRPA
ncbi:LPS export ABC transporter permease LptF [Thiohalospira sp.]|uniref:LPS export ABC transporter permease LptF n=1 Tax=Thiohalospira sp. TaxID=3080549 RepID=UPI00397FA558